MERVPKSDIERIQATVMMSALEKMRQQKLFTDVVLYIGDAQFSAHKVVLCAGSAYFRSMFQSGMRESTSGSVHLKNVSCDALTIVLRYLYTAKINEVQDVQLLKEMLATSHMLQLDALYSYYFQILLEDLTPVDFTELWDLVCLYDNADAQEHIVSVLAKRYQQICHSQDFLELTKMQLKTLLRHPELNSDADEVVNSIVEWVKHDVHSRQSDLPELFASVPLSSASLQCIQRLQKEAIIQSSNDVILKLSDFDDLSATNHDTPPSEDELQITHHSIDESHEAKLAVCYTNQGTYYVKVYYPLKRLWGAEQRVPFAVQPCATVAVTFDGDILFIGGTSCPGDSFLPLDTVCKYNMNSKCLQYTTSMSRARCKPGVGLFRGHVYVVGGKSSLIPLTCSNTVEKYNCITDRWTEVPNTLYHYSAPEVMQVLEFLYVVGLDYSSLDFGIEKYDLMSRQWSLVRTLTDHHSERVIATVWRKQILIRMEDGDVFCLFHPESGSFETRTFEESPENISKICSQHTRRDCPIFVLDGHCLYSFEPDNSTNAWTKLSHTIPPSVGIVGLTMFG